MADRDEDVRAVLDIPEREDRLEVRVLIAVWEDPRVMVLLLTLELFRKGEVPMVLPEVALTLVDDNRPE